LSRAAGLIEPPMAHKLSDSAIGYLPFDCFVMAGGGCAAYIVVAWHCEGGAGFTVRTALSKPRVYAIGVQAWVAWRAGLGCERASLSEMEAGRIGLTLKGV